LASIQFSAIVDLAEKFQYSSKGSSMVYALPDLRINQKIQRIVSFQTQVQKIQSQP